MRHVALASILILSAGCVKQEEFTPGDAGFVLTPDDIPGPMAYQKVPLKNGLPHFFTRTANSFGLYWMYGSMIIGTEAGDTLKWNARGNKFHNQADIDKLYRGNVLSTKLFKNHLVSFDAGSLGALDGFCISAEDHFQVELKGDRTLLGLTVEGRHRLVLDSIAPFLRNHLLALGEVEL